MQKEIFIQQYVIIMHCAILFIYFYLDTKFSYFPHVATLLHSLQASSYCLLFANIKVTYITLAIFRV